MDEDFNVEVSDLIKYVEAPITIEEDGKTYVIYSDVTETYPHTGFFLRDQDIYS